MNAYIWGIDLERDSKRTQVNEGDSYQTKRNYLFEVGDLRRGGLLEVPAVLELCKRLFSSVRTFVKDTWHHVDILKVHLPAVTLLDFDDYNSAITRSVEFNHPDRLAVLIDHLPRIKTLASHTDYLLMLRKASIGCYLTAKEHGFCDPELEKRIVLIQRLWRSRRSRSPAEVRVPAYGGPYPEDYAKTPSLLDGEGARYWGYRHTTYFCRWNRRKRYLILKRLLGEWWGDCRYEGYKDLVEGGDENFLVPKPE